MEIIERVLDTTEKKVFDLMFTKKEFEKWLAKNNLEFNTENLKKYKDYCFNWVLENVWEIQRQFNILYGIIKTRNEGKDL